MCPSDDWENWKWNEMGKKYTWIGKYGFCEPTKWIAFARVVRVEINERQLKSVCVCVFILWIHSVFRVFIQFVWDFRCCFYDFFFHFLLKKRKQNDLLERHNTLCKQIYISTNVKLKRKNGKERERKEKHTHTHTNIPICRITVVIVITYLNCIDWWYSNRKLNWMEKLMLTRTHSYRKNNNEIKL